MIVSSLVLSTCKNIEMYRGWEIHWATACSSSVGRWAAPHWTEWRWGEGAPRTLRQTGWTYTATAWEKDRRREVTRPHTAQPRCVENGVANVIQRQRVGTKGEVTLKCSHPNQQPHKHTRGNKSTAKWRLHRSCCQRDLPVNYYFYLRNFVDGGIFNIIWKSR